MVGVSATEQQSYENRGYLHEAFRLFHLSESMEEAPDWHYHTFHKIIVLHAGQFSYGIEGRSYPLQSGDIVLVPQGCIHRPEVRPGEPYERTILYLSPEFLREAGSDTCQLESCFEQARSRFSFVVRPRSRQRELTALLSALERALNEGGFGSDVLTRSMLLEFLIRLTRGMQSHELLDAKANVCDEKIAAILRYLAEHLKEPVSIDELAAKFYISKYHMMRRFREETGYSIHSYLVSKRLMLARELLSGGMPVMEACYECGFSDYSAFSRAYRKQFLQKPSDARNL